MAEAKRVAMWSGPRNISTAMMRSFGSRRDTIVCDEPFYAVYLSLTGIDHPMNEEVIAAGETDPAKVIAALLGPLPEGRTVFYQKHMTHHMIDAIPREWMDEVENVFLIREPERVLSSYVKKREAVEARDIGFEQQQDIFDRVADRLGHAPPVVDSADVLRDPRGTLSALCETLGIGFDEAMLKWEPGLRPTDGVWAVHWYQAVAASRGFEPPADGAEALPPHLMRIAEAVRPAYEKLAAHKVAAS
jgi:Sulfotransferase domain